MTNMIQSISVPRYQLRCFADARTVDAVIQFLEDHFGHLKNHDEGWQTGFAPNRADTRVWIHVPTRFLKNLTPETGIAFGYGMLPEETVEFLDIHADG